MAFEADAFGSSRSDGTMLGFTAFGATDGDFGPLAACEPFVGVEDVEDVEVGLAAALVARALDGRPPVPFRCASIDAEDTRGSRGRLAYSGT